MKQVICWCCLLFNFVAVFAHGTIAVKTVDAYTGYTVNAHIELQGTDTFTHTEAGRIETELPEGKYSLSVFAAGYEKQVAEYTINNAERLNITVRLTPIHSVIENVIADTYTFYVSAEHTGVPVAGAKVYFAIENKTVLTDANGIAAIRPSKFTDTGNPDNTPITTDIKVSYEGLCDYTLKDVPVVRNAFTIPVALGRVRKWGAYKQHVLNAASNNEQPVTNNTIAEETEQPTISRQACTPGATIRVGTNCSCTTCTSVQQMSLESYVQSGLENEWIASWNAASLQAGAVAYRSYGAYFINNPVAANYDIANTTCNQVWDATTASSCIAAANATGGMVLSNSGGTIFKSEYSAETNNHNCGNCFSGETPNWVCISDSVCCGTTAFAHGRGMCQWGSKRWGDAPNNKTYDWILSHYYNPGGVIVCGTCSPVANDNCGTAIPLTVSEVCNPLAGTLLCANDDNYPNPPTCDGFSNPAQKGVFYSFVANSNAVTISVDPAGTGGNAVDAVVSVYTGSTCTTLQQFACFGGSGNGGGVTKTETINGLTIGQTYYVRIYDYGTIDPSFPEFTICAINAPATNIDEANSIGLQVYPNPNSGVFNISADLKYTGTWTLGVCDVLGQVVYSKEGEGTVVNMQVDLQNHAKGFYLIKLVSEGGSIIKKVEVR